MIHHTEQIGTALLISIKQCTYMNYKLNSELVTQQKSLVQILKFPFQKVFQTSLQFLHNINSTCKVYFTFDTFIKYFIVYSIKF